jgi:hypothetical protein
MSKYWELFSINRFLCVCLLLLAVVGGSVGDRYELGNSFSGSFLLLEDIRHILMNGDRQRLIIYHAI